MKIFATLFMLFMASTSIAQIPLTGLKAYFPFTGNAGDSSGNATHGTTNNVTLTTDRYGNANSAYDFSGNTNSYISFPSTNVKNNTFTWSLWAKITEAPANGGYEMLLEIAEGGNATGQNLDLANNYLGQYTGFGGGGYNTTSPNFKIRKGSLPANNEWFHLVVVRDTSFILFFINNVRVDSHGVANKILPKYGTTVKANIGIRCDLTSPFDGSIDEVCIYNRPLSRAEITKLYSNNKPNSVANSVKPLFNVFPNPTTGQLHISGNLNEVAKVDFFNSQGKKVLSQDLKVEGNSSLNIGQFSEGIYYVKLVNSRGETLLNERIVKTN